MGESSKRRGEQATGVRRGQGGGGAVGKRFPMQHEVETGKLFFHEPLYDHRRSQD